ncbi:cold-shock protein [Prauserella muralis]|uniref:DNA-binding protein n=1 Tax=Prauserella muralis TaxID=588067 RepID=A0A2V4AKC4_9PSEU|nr:cold shock domain-containing protein [Prauserella muralis]PXY20715.1 DNA-binding protein [Prauserella muralis]TWE29722.1 putative cold-shock DNA-binding protein [Prauserella muralis]
MVTGKVIRFDESKGYGFVAPDAGGEDVFVHVNDLDFDKRLLTPGALVEFEVEDGDRGLKASRVRMVGRAGAEAGPVSDRDDEDGYDVLTVGEYLAEVTEVLLDAAPGVTAEQILAIRQRLVQLAHSHGWVDP